MRTVHHRFRVALAAAALFTLPSAAFAPWGMEGVGVVSTRDDELRATISPDGAWVVWASPDRPGGPGGGDLWRARRLDGRWQHPEAVAVDTADGESAPGFSADGRWLYFVSNRPGGFGGDDLYRAPVDAQGGIGQASNLGSAINTRGDEWAPTPSRGGRRLLFASNGARGARRHDLFVATWNGKAFTGPRPVPGLATDADEFDAAWLDDGNGIVFARSVDASSKPTRLYVATCRAGAYTSVEPLALAFNTGEARTQAPVLDWNRPNEMLVSGAAPSPKAGKSDIYRILVPSVHGDGSCR
ncbi:TolB family protein [Cognatilysobacter lacus]|uniref:TolB family protein n=1 Tax=Cognatilysobacter lacus TaxID=1643323 RepID=UPI001F2AD4C6|nr:TolB-like protein [Lysobacter lacus]